MFECKMCKTVLLVNYACFIRKGYCLNSRDKLVHCIIQSILYYVYATDPKEAWLGIEGSNVTPAIAQTLDLQQPRGFLIFAVETTSPADVAGLRGGDRIVTIDGSPVVVGGDVIIAIDNTQIQGAEDIEALLASKTIGDSIRFTVIRGNSTEDFDVVLGAR
jgi:S1-C subfamily serine protease